LAASSKPSVQQWIRDLTSRYVDVFAKFHSQAAQRFTIWTQNFNERYV
jgi:exonuclease III